MTMTDSPPTAQIAPSALSPRVVGLYDALTTTDHKRIGRLWLWCGGILLVAATIVGVALGIEGVDPASVDVFGGDNNYFQFWSLYRFGLALLVAVPLFIGLSTIVVPMQVGATNIAFPRAAHAAVWSFAIGAGITVISVIAGGGWGALDGVTGDERDAIALTLVGTGMVIISLLLASICIATTVVSLRTSGMTLMRVPLFAWSMLVAAAVWLLTLPVALANIILIYFDLRGGPQLFGAAEGSAAIYGQLAWLVEQPQVYAFAIPVLGILGSIVPSAAGVRHAHHAMAVGLIGFFGLLSIGGWSQPFFQGSDHDEKFVFICFGLLAIVPVLGSLGGVLDTLARGEGRGGLPSAHLLGALGGVILLLVGTSAGLARVVQPWHLGERATVTGVMNLVLFAAIGSAVAGIWFWAPKIGGRELSTGLGRLLILALVGGAFLLGLADVVSGFFEADMIQLASPDDDIVEVFNLVGAVGSALIALGALGVLVAIAQALRSSEGASENPFGGQTLEWATASPPPVGNFSEPLPRVVSEAPLLDTDGEEEEA